MSHHTSIIIFTGIGLRSLYYRECKTTKKTCLWETTQSLRFVDSNTITEKFKAQQLKCISTVLFFCYFYFIFIFIFFLVQQLKCILKIILVSNIMLRTMARERFSGLNILQLYTTLTIKKVCFISPPYPLHMAVVY